MMRRAIVSSFLLAVALSACQLDTKAGLGTGGNPLNTCEGGVLCDGGLSGTGGDLAPVGGNGESGQGGNAMVMVGVGGMSSPAAPKKLDGDSCAADVDCMSGHCNSAICCASGDCCKAPADCPNMIVDGIQLACNDPSKCEGSGGSVRCNNFRCVAMGGEPNDMACTTSHKANDCAPYKPVYCNGMREQQAPPCPTSCRSDDDCAADAHCDLFGACVKDMPDGGLCTMDKDCVSGHCSNGVCCKGGDCCLTAQVCQGYSSPAQCTDVSTCTGARKEAVCMANQCMSMEIPDRGACVGKLVKDCGLFADAVCSNRVITPTCATTCQVDTHCKTNAFCDRTANGGRGECKPKREDGETCTETQQCKTKCNKGFCCNDSDPNSYCCGSSADCTVLNKSQCAREDNTCDGVVQTATCTTEHRCRVTTMPDTNACKRNLSCGPGYARLMPCPLGCYCSNPLDCASGYRCSEAPDGRGKCVLDTGAAGMSGGAAGMSGAPGM